VAEEHGQPLSAQTAFLHAALTVLATARAGLSVGAKLV